MKTVKDYNLPLNSLKHKQKVKNNTELLYLFVLTLSKQSKAQQNMGAGYASIAHPTS